MPAHDSGNLAWRVGRSAGTTALNAATYLDMALRGRPASDSPGQLVEQGTDLVGVTIPGDKDERGNRLQRLGPLVGITVGIAVGATAGALHRAFARRGRSLPPPLR